MLKESDIDFSKNNLHLVGYSVPFEGKVELNELKKHLFTLPEKPNAIPYITSYYKERWGFCLTQEEFDTLENGTYKVVIKSTLFNGELKLLKEDWSAPLKPWASTSII